MTVKWIAEGKTGNYINFYLFTISMFMVYSFVLYYCKGIPCVFTSLNKMVFERIIQAKNISNKILHQKVYHQIFFKLNSYLFIFNFFILFLYFWVHWVFVACTGFSLQWLLLCSMGSRCVGFSSCGTWAQQLWLTDSRAQAQQLWHTGLVAPWHVGFSWTRARTRARTCVPCIGRRILNQCTTGEALYYQIL